VKDDQWPFGAVVLRKRPFHDGPHVLEEVIPQRGFLARRFRSMRNDGTALVCKRVDGPGNVLFDSDREPGTQSPFDSVGILAFVQIAIVCIQDRPVMIQKFKRRLLCEECGRGKDAND